MKTLLFIDRDQSKLKLLQNTFGDEYEIKGLKTGKECLLHIEHLEKNNDELPEVVIVDYELPDMNGIELQDILQDSLEDTKVILIVPREQDEVLLQIIRKGFMNYIMKDYNYIALLSNMIKKRTGVII